MVGEWEKGVEPPCTDYAIALLYEGEAGRVLEMHRFVVSGLMPLTPDEAKARADKAIREEWAARPNLGFDPAVMSLEDWSWATVKTKEAA